MKPFAELLSRYLDDLQLRNYSPRTVSDYGYSLRALAVFLAHRAIVDVAAISGAILGDFQRWLYHQPTRQGMARGVCNQNAVLSAVRSFFRYLRRDGYIVRDPAAELEYAREPRRLPRNVLTPAEARRILEAAKSSSTLGQRDRTILEVLYATGIRASELRHLKPGDIDLEQGLLRVNQGKGGVDRVVPLGAVACRHLATYLAAIRPALSASTPCASAPPGSPPRANTPCERLFLSATGKPIDPHTLGDIVKRYAKLARIKKHVTCHVWRHSCATHLIQNRANVRHVQEMLGHRSLSTTERYLHLTIADLKAAHRRFHPREKGE